MAAASNPEEKPPPNDINAEQATLGACLVEAKACELVLGIVQSEDFYPEGHQRIFAAIRALADKSQPVDLTTVRAELRRQGQLEAVGGGEYLIVLIDEVPMTAHVVRYAQIVRDKARLRKIAKAGAEVHRQAYDNPEDLAEFMAEVREKLMDVTDPTDIIGLPPHATAAEVREFLGTVEWLWPGRVPRGYITEICGRSEIGKSSLALRLAASVADRRPWPAVRGADADEVPVLGEPHKVLYVDNEGTKQGQAQRVCDWGYSEENIIFLGAKDGSERYALDDPKTMPAIRAIVEKYEVPLIIFDSFRASFSGDENSSEVGELLVRWTHFAQEHKLAIVIVVHPNKEREWDKGVLNLDRVRGSSAIVDCARSVIALDHPDPEDETVHIHCIKQTFAEKPEPLGMLLTDTGPEFCEPPRAPRRDTLQARAEEFLQAKLTKGARPVGELLEEAQKQGITRATLYLAKKKLDLKELPDPTSGRKKQWGLPARETLDE